MDTSVFDDDHDPEPDEWNSAHAMNELREMRGAFQPLLTRFKEHTESFKNGKHHPLDQIDDAFEMMADMLMLRYGRAQWMASRQLEKEIKWER